MYLSVFNSFRVIRCLSQCVSPKIAIFTTFLFPLGSGDAPEAITLNVVRMEREFDAYKLSRCICPSNYYCFWDTARYLWKKSSFYHTPLHSFDGSRRNIGTTFGTEKLEWCRYPMVKKFRIYVCSFWRDPRTWRTDGRTDRQTLHDSKDRACIASRGKNNRIQCSNSGA